jgi:hypothetical protein
MPPFLHCLFRAGCAVSTIAAPLIYASPGTAQQIPADLKNPQIEIQYAEPTKNPELAPIRERAMNRRALETFQNFLAPLQLTPDQKLVLRLDECGGESYVRYKRQRPATATVCYELLERIEEYAPTAAIQLYQTGNRPVPADAGIVGPYVNAMLHEIAVAVFDVLDIPVWGRQDDAADRVAALIMLQFNKLNVAWPTIVGTAWFLAASTVSPADFAETRGIMAQRYYTTLCIAFGGDRATFGGFVAASARSPYAGDLPDARAVSCREDYLTLLDGVKTTISPKLDRALMRRVQDPKIKWF